MSNANDEKADDEVKLKFEEEVQQQLRLIQSREREQAVRQEAERRIEREREEKETPPSFWQYLGVFLALLPLVGLVIVFIVWLLLPREVILVPVR